MKNTMKKLTIFVLVLAIASLGSIARAADFSMMAAKDHPKATGTLDLSKDKVSIRAEGLKPDSIYTVWFVNMKPKKSQAGAGTMPYMFKTDSQGKGSYESSLSESPFGTWQMVMVVLHPDGDPTAIWSWQLLKRLFPKSPPLEAHLSPFHLSLKLSTVSLPKTRGGHSNS